MWFTYGQVFGGPAGIRVLRKSPKAPVISKKIVVFLIIVKQMKFWGNFIIFNICGIYTNA